MTGMMKKLFEVSAIPARALYQAKKAAANPKPPPALTQEGLGWSSEFSYMYAMASMRKARSRVKKRRKNARVDFKVQTRSTVVKINQPFFALETSLLSA